VGACILINPYPDGGGLRHVVVDGSSGMAWRGMKPNIQHTAIPVLSKRRADKLGLDVDGEGRGM